MSLEPLIAKFTEKMKANPQFKACVKFDFGKDGAIFADSTKRPAELREATDDDDADLTLTLSKDLLMGFMNGTKDPNVAYLMGKLKVRGPMGLAMKLNALLED